MPCGNWAAPIVCTAVLVDPDERQKAALADDLEVGDDGSYSLTVQVVSAFDPAANDVEVTRNVIKDGRAFRATSAYRLNEVGFAFLPATRSPDRELSEGQTSALRALLRGVDLADERDGVASTFAPCTTSWTVPRRSRRCVPNWPPSSAGCPRVT